MKKLIILAVLLRVIIMPFFFHPDIKTYYFQTSFLKKGVFNIYNYLTSNKETLPLREDFTYYPLTYFFLGSYQIISSPFLGSGFDSWLSDASQEYASNLHVFRYLFILKLPHLVLDILIAFVLAKFFEDKKVGKRAMMLWLFNPFTIAIIYLYSGIDIIPVFLSLLSFLLLKKNRLILSAVLLALSIGFKLYPLLFLPLVLFEIRDIKKISIYLLTIFATLGVTILPFFGEAFKSSALLSGLTTRILTPQISLGFGESIVIPLVLIGGLFYLGFVNLGNGGLLKYVTVLLLILFSFIHFHIQWLLWIAPLLIILVNEDRKLASGLVVTSLLGLLIPFLYDDRAMTFSLLRSISSLYTLIPSLYTIVLKFYDSATLISIIHSLFAGVSLIFSYKILNKKE